MIDLDEHQAHLFRLVRERVGKAEEEIVPPAPVTTVAELMRWLGERGQECPRVRASEIDPRRHRQEPRARETRSPRPRDRVLPAMTVDDADDGPVAAREFDAAAEAAALTRGRTDIGALVTFTGIAVAPNPASRSQR